MLMPVTEHEMLHAEIMQLRASYERLQRAAGQLHGDNEQLKQTLLKVMVENERLEAHKRILTEEGKQQLDALRAENERLRAVVEAAQAFVHQHQIGQPGTPGTLYPMTYGVQDQWHEEWDRRLAALIAACRT